ncbi:MAG TPA: hypothetical protein VMR70_14940 [Flavisolibacter sp.]|nr:hypothetical protein [Flavisolibacter sp.]
MQGLSSYWNQKYIAMRFRIFLAFSVLLLFSCKKEGQAFENEGLHGKWRLTERFDGYGNGGGFKWHKVAFDNSHSLEFTASKSYTKRENISGSFQECTGTYQHLPDNTLEINSNCQTITERAKISELTSKKLIIDRQGREGIIRYQYTPER